MRPPGQRGLFGWRSADEFGDLVEFWQLNRWVLR
jgi:hypothetical protein